MKRLLFVIALVACCFTAFAQYPTIHNYRPRIYADTARINWLHDNILIAGDCQNTYNQFINAYNANWINDPQLYLLGNDSTQWTWDWNSQWAGWEGFFAVTIYKITNDTLALKRCRFIAQQYINRIDTTNYAAMDWFTKESELRAMSDAGSMLLDWCYDAFPDSLQHELARAHYTMTREFMNTYILSSAGDAYVSSHNAWNNVYCNQNTLALYDADGLTQQQKDTVVQWYQAVYDKWINGFLPVYGYYRDDDGGWNWGAAYAMWSLVDQFQLFENMRVGTDKNFYQDLPWVQNSINQYWYFIQPDNKCIHLGDGQTTLTSDRVMYLHARYFNDLRSLWLAQEFSLPQNLTWTVPLFQKLFYKDFNMPMVTKPQLPLDWWADKVGLSVSRSSWNSDATMVTFFNAPSKRAAHEHRDNNSFTVFKHAPLLIDAGYYDAYNTEHARNYYTRTIAHNTICVYDSTEQYSAFGQPSSNDGGQLESTWLTHYNEIFLPQNQRGKWLRYGTGANYTYNAADAQLSYDTAKLDLFRRRLLYLRPNKIIVLDHVHLKNTSTHQRDIKWIAHFAQEPDVSGTMTNALVTDHIETFDGSDYTAQNGGGNVALRTLLPQSTNTTRIGGTGYEYWVDSVNYAPSPAPDTTYYTPGKWRIEVRPNIVTDTVVFLHTIDIGDSANVAQAGGIAFANETSVGADWNDTLFFFTANGDTTTSYQVFNNVTGNRVVGIFATDMASDVYMIRVDGNTALTQLAVDANGVLQTSLPLSAGLHTVEILPDNSGTNNATAFDNNVLVFPNPAQDYFQIITNTDGVAAYNLYNTVGQQVLSGIFMKQVSVNCVGLPRGVYFVQVKSSTATRVLKITLE